MTHVTAAYACAERASGKTQCNGWCADQSRCPASEQFASARAEIERRYTGQGAAAPRGASNPYREGSAAATWWARGNAGVEAPRKITSVAEFCAEAERIGLTAADLAEALKKRPEFADCLPDSHGVRDTSGGLKE